MLKQNITADGNFFRGFMVVDAKSGEVLAKQNENAFFTPASNVKIFTLYMGLTMISDKLPAFHYVERQDTLYVRGTGDPTLWHAEFENENAANFLKSKENIVLYLDNYLGKRYRPGWAWEDYDAYFSAEIGPFPMYGNVVTINQKDSLTVLPKYFSENTFRANNGTLRAERQNLFFLPFTLDTLRIPFITDSELTTNLLQKATGANVLTVKKNPSENWKVFRGITADTLYRKMMFKSDNFLAEQITLMASSTVSDTLSFEIARKKLLDSYLTDLKQPPRWVDGSGLSRYNLFTPESMVQVLTKLYTEVSHERLFHLFPFWNENGTVATTQPEGNNFFIMAKSGALGNNYNLSGYLKTKSGNVLIFSFMNNHFRVVSSEVRKQIYNFLNEFYESH